MDQEGRWAFQASLAFPKNSNSTETIQTLLFMSNHEQTQREVPLEIPVAVVPNCIA